MAGLRRAVHGLWWWVTSVMGDHDYARYAEHLRRAHPDAPVPRNASTGAPGTRMRTHTRTHAAADRAPPGGYNLDDTVMSDSR